MRRIGLSVAAAVLLGLLALVPEMAPVRAAGTTLTLASTTSTEQSGLFEYLLPIFTQATGITVRVVAVGTGQALKLGERGDADALLVHDRPGEEDLVRRGHALDRRDVMYNDFIIVGPTSDPAGIRGSKDATTALTRIAAAKAAFVSRGDDSGTNRLELRLWQSLHLDMKAAGHGVAGQGWYRELGTGMGPTLNTAAALNAYTIADRATWANFKNRQTLAVLVEGDKALFNPYSSLLVSPSKSPSIHAAEAKIWHEWLTSPDGQRAIANYRIGGEQLFFLMQPQAAH